MSSLTSGDPFSTRETVWCDTPIAAATSAMLGPRPLARAGAGWSGMGAIVGAAAAYGGRTPRVRSLNGRWTWYDRRC